jgi:primosomal replication protein N
VNQLCLTASIAESKPLRWTPAGLPALELLLEHESQVLEAGANRVVKAVVKTVVIGTLAETLSKQALGSVWQFTGFLTTPKNGKQLIFHIQAFQSL